MNEPVISGGTPPTLPTLPSVQTSASWVQWEDLLDIFYAPRAVFERRRDGRYWFVLLAICALSVAVYFLGAQINDAIQDVEFARSMAKQEGMTPEAIEGAKAFSAKIKGALVYVIPFGVILGAFTSGLLIMLLCNMMGGKLTFSQATAIGVLASMPEMLGRLLMASQGFFLDANTIVHRYSFAFNASRFMSADSNNWLLKLGALADPFVIWGTVLIGVGVWIIGKLEKEKAAAHAVIIALLMMALVR